MQPATVSVFPKPLDLTIWAGGQTGADQGALQWAVANGIPHGGYCPRGRLTEDGGIPTAFKLTELGAAGYRGRTERNVSESDGTVIFTIGHRLCGGSRLTAEFAVQHRKPLLHVHETTLMPGVRLVQFIREHKIRILNVAGSRASKEPGVTRFVHEVLSEIAKPPTCGMKRITVLTISDLHQRGGRYAKLHEAVDRHRPDLVAVVGDFLDIGDTSPDRLTPAECAKILAAIPCGEVVFVPGNHEGVELFEFLDTWQSCNRNPLVLARESFVLGPLVIVGFPCGMGDSTDLLRLPPLRLDRWLPSLVHARGPAARTLWLMHEPPTDTPLSEAVGAMAGNPEWGDALDRYHPIVTVCGHDHQTPIGTGRWTWQPPWDGVVVNVGQAMTGPLRYCLLTFEFPSDTPCLPHRVKIEAFPLGATVEWPPQKHQE